MSRLSAPSPHKALLLEDEGEESAEPPARPAVGVTSVMVTVAVCTIYMLVGPLLILSNKYLLTSGFGYPIILTTIHQLSSALCCSVLIRGCRAVPLQHDMPWSTWRSSILAVGLATTAALCFGNSSYMFLTVAFIEILKGFTPVVTIVVQSCFGEPFPRIQSVLAVLLISVGTAISSYGELRLDVTGLALMLASIYSEATRLMLTQKLLHRMDLHVLEGLYYLAPASALCSAIVAIVVELPHFRWRRVYAMLPHTWHLFAANALLGFLVNVTGFLVIKRTSVVMLKLLAIARNALVVFAGIMLFADRVSTLQFIGYSISLTFFALYNYLQIRPDGCSCGSASGHALTEPR